MLEFGFPATLTVIGPKRQNWPDAVG